MTAVSFVKSNGNRPATVISNTIQSMPDSGVMTVGIRGEGLEQFKVGPNDPSTASVQEIAHDATARTRWFQFHGKRPCNVMVEARGTDGAVASSFQLAIRTPAKLEPPKSPTLYEFEADDPKRPGDINLREYTPRNEPDYLENQVTAVGFGIYLFGCLVYTKSLDLPVLVPDAYIDFTVGSAQAIDTNIYASRAAADEAIRIAPAMAAGQTPFAYYRGAGGALIFPTVVSPATAPLTIQTLLTARALVVEEVRQELLVHALSIVGGMVLKGIITRLIRVGSKTAEPLAANPPKLALQKASARLRDTARDLQSMKPIRSSEVLTQPKTFRHSLTAEVPSGSYANIEKEGALRLSTGAKAHYGEGVYAWHAGQARIGVYIDIEVPAGTGVETINVGGQSWVRMVPPEGNMLPVRIVGTNLPQSQIDMGRMLAKSAGK